MARFWHPEDQNLELALEDVFLLPDFWDGESRRDVDLTPVDFPGGSHPFVSANMNAVTGKRMAEVMARCGGLGVLPQDIPSEQLQRMIAAIKGAHTRYDTALTIGPDEPIRDVRAIINKRSSTLVVVLDGEQNILGVIAPRDLEEKDSFTAAQRVMTKTPVVLQETVSAEDAFEILRQANIKAAPVVDSRGKLIGTLSRQDLLIQKLTTPTLDSQQRLMVAVAIGINGRPAERAAEAVDFGADLIVIDTAHGDQRKMLIAIEAVRDAVGHRAIVVAGNVCTAEATTRLIQVGANGVKVNIGPGAMCTTRMVTGVGRPSFSAVHECAEAANELGGFVWADGGIKHRRDLPIYMAAGATRVMAGTLFAGTHESAEDVQTDASGRLFKSNRGMASSRSVQERNGGVSPLELAVRMLFEEGVSTSQVYLQAGSDSVVQIMTRFATALMSAMTYVGAPDLKVFRERAVIGVQTHAGFFEGTPHGKVRG